MTISACRVKGMGPDYFSMKGRANLYIEGQVNVKFTPLRKRKALLSRSILPTFNHDRKCYTLAFRTPSAQMDNEEELLLNYKLRLIAADRQLSEMLYPKPSSTSCYCAVCRTRYEDYKTHVQSEEHHQRIQSSVFQQFILQTALKMREDSDKREDDSPTIDNSYSDEKLFECLTLDLINDGGF